MNVDDVVAAKVEAARRKAAVDKRRRSELEAARQAGLGQRHAAKLRAQARPPRPADRTAACPACRAVRPVRRLTGITLPDGRPHDVLSCQAPDCGLIWCVRAATPRLGGGAA